MEHFCFQCGSYLVTKVIENRIREVCPDCQWIYYPQLKVTAGVLVLAEGKLLLVQRAKDPWKGCWYLPAGYVDDDETPRMAAEREAKEETGFNINTGDLIEVYYYGDDPRGNGLLILYSGIISGGEIKNNAEAMAIEFFNPETALQLKLAGGSHDKAILQWLATVKKRATR
jgi:ADP-ribose pyrophosphatase YjhB (NUDIX family)